MQHITLYCLYFDTFLSVEEICIFTLVYGGFDVLFEVMDVFEGLEGGGIDVFGGEGFDDKEGD